MLVDAAINHERLSSKIAALVAGQENNQRRTIVRLTSITDIKAIRIFIIPVLPIRDFNNNIYISCILWC